MAYWLVKSEPFKYSWEQLQTDGRTHWDGVRNHQAALNLKGMKRGDKAFFYHSNEGLAVVGVCEIVKEAYPDPSDAAGRFVMVDVTPVVALPRPVTLKEIKADPALDGIALVRQSRLSVMPIEPAHWKHICRLGGLKKLP